MLRQSEGCEFNPHMGREPFLGEFVGLPRRHMYGFPVPVHI